MTVPTGLTVSGTPITTSGTLAVVFASGYSIPTNTGQSNWNTAYTYSTVGHLPLAGGTLTGDLTLDDGSGGSPHIIFQDDDDVKFRVYNDDTNTLIITREGNSGADFVIQADASNYTSSYLTIGGSTVSPTKIGQWNTAYGWGNHAGLYLSLGGGTMSGDVDMGGNRITEGVFVTQSGTSDDFLKGDGTLDSTAYLPLTGGTLSGDVTFTGATHHAMWDKSASALEFWDNAKLTFGDPGGTPDLEIYHDGSNSYINETGTGDLIIKGGNDIIFKDAVDNLLVNMNQSNSVELYYGGSKKFETTSTGATVTGSIQMSDDTDTASASKVGTQRYRTSGNNSYVDMCMQTGATTYEWINILENNW
jgi:hypothetical protein